MCSRLLGDCDESRNVKLISVFILVMSLSIMATMNMLIISLSIFYLNTLLDKISSGKRANRTRDPIQGRRALLNNIGRGSLTRSLIRSHCISERIR